jgi:predicted nucleic acid-binding Zn ribbon protein
LGENKMKMKICPICKESIIPEDQETCSDCKVLDHLIDLELVRDILLDLVEADIVLF